jgi:C-terminal processing protease CtpA/Prc
MNGTSHCWVNYRRFAPVVVVLLLLAPAATSRPTVNAQQQPPPSKFQIDRFRLVLGTIKEDIKKNYYDPNYHGMDLDVAFKEADEKIKQATSLGQIMGIIGQLLINLDDSHTFFLPPGRSYRTNYGWRMQMIGDKCYVVAVEPGSDAEAKGLKEGDQIYSIDGRFMPMRKNLWKIEYLYNHLRPQPAVRLVVVKPDGQRQQIDALAKVRQGKLVKDLTGEDGGGDIWDLEREDEQFNHLYRQRYVEMGDDLFIWKMPMFDLPKPKVDEIADKFRKRKTLILDLRGNGGGYEETLLRLIGNLFDHDVKVGDLKRRKEEKPLNAKTRGGNIFDGKLIVLIDSKSASAAELLARVVQLEKRGTVIGDVSEGAVMRAREFSHDQGIDIKIFYGVSVTDADLIMTDGKSLEHAGVTPDEIKLPTAEDLAAKRDPVLAYAASLAGVKISPEKAGEMFPVEWYKDQH